MTARDTLAFFRLWVVVLLATIGLQALEPVSAPLQRETGSAFSASTAEVALDSARRSDATVVRTVPAPVLTPTLPIMSLTLPTALLASTQYRPHLARAPPPRESAQRLPDLRGPPIA